MVREWAANRANDQRLQGDLPWPSSQRKQLAAVAVEDDPARPKRRSTAAATSSIRSIPEVQWRSRRTIIKTWEISVEVANRHTTFVVVVVTWG
jgi:hypothetical protein